MENIENEFKYLVSADIFQEKVLEIVNLFNLGNLSLVNHVDCYYDDNNILSDLGISFRRRIADGYQVFNVKEQIVGNEKRNELVFSSYDEAINYIKIVYGVSVNFDKIIKINTYRNYVLFKYESAYLEIAFDTMFPYNKERGFNRTCMVEVEFKGGNFNDFICIYEKLTDIDGLELTDLSKLEIALLGNEDKVRKLGKNE